MNDRTFRWVICFALVPLCAPLWWLIGEYPLAVLGGDSLKQANALMSLILFATCIAVWRTYIRWTHRRVVGTLGIYGAALLQAALAIPLWSVSGCGKRELVCTSQTLVCSGLAGICVALVWWWVWLAQPPGRNLEVKQMTPSAARMTLSLSLAPLLVGVYWITWAALDQFAGSLHYAILMLIAYAVAMATFLASWLAVWRKQVNWTPVRLHWTWIWSILLSLSVLSPLLEFIKPSIGGRLFDVVTALGPLMFAGIYLVATAVLWREDAPSTFTLNISAAERYATCPQCGYSLRGLSELRCPECGWTSTIELFVGHTLCRAADSD